MILTLEDIYDFLELEINLEFEEDGWPFWGITLPLYEKGNYFIEGPQLF